MTDSAHMWRGRMNEYNICSDTSGDCVNIGLGDCDYTSSFLNIFIDSDGIPSPFKNREDAELFAKIMVKLLKVITNDIE